MYMPKPFLKSHFRKYRAKLLLFFHICKRARFFFEKRCMLCERASLCTCRYPSRVVYFKRY